MKTIFESIEWQELINKENRIGAENVLNEILEKRSWTNVEIMWVIKRILFHYALHDKVLKKAPVDTIFDNMASLAKAFYMVFDHANPDLDENIRAYICAKLTEATWGICGKSRYYLERME